MQGQAQPRLTLIVPFDRCVGMNPQLSRRLLPQAFHHDLRWFAGCDTLANFLYPTIQFRFPQVIGIHRGSTSSDSIK
ncbi:MAG: hypothetical protein DWH91_02560 [Planctomycetota bacterium]|nr:MAG: hypothetical protein DWH91_02560 [Planctomycetota bacterium]